MNECDRSPVISCDYPKKKVGYAYVPVQILGKVYCPSAALENGTVFPELDIKLDEYERGLWCGK